MRGAMASPATDSALQRLPVEAAVLEVLEPLLGRFTARRALALACPPNMTEPNIDAVLTRLRPMLRTLLGAAAAEHALKVVRLLACGEEIAS